MRRAFILALLLAVRPLPAAPAPEPGPAAAVGSPGSRVASIFISQDFINELIAQHLHTPVLKDLSLLLDPVQGWIIARGLCRIPVDEARSIGLDQGLRELRFQVVIKPKATRKGHLILVFPLDETFFYPAGAKDPQKERIYVPVQFLSLALGSARGYLAMLSGDFSGFERQARSLEGQIAELKRLLIGEKDQDQRGILEARLQSLRLQLQGIPIEKRLAERMSKTYSHLIGFVGGQEMSLNQELAVHQNALILRLQLAQLAPYLAGVELGGVRILKDNRDGSGMPFLAIDVAAQLAKPMAPPAASTGTAKVEPRKPPLVVLRLNQALFESEALLSAEAKVMAGRARDFGMAFKDDGLHIFGRWRVPLLPDVPFRAVLDFVWVAPGVFDIRVRDLAIEHVELRFLTKLVLEAVQRRLEGLFSGACKFQYMGEEADGARAVRATIAMPSLLPAFPGLSLTGIATRDQELILKAGRP